MNIFEWNTNNIIEHNISFWFKIMYIFLYNNKYIESNTHEQATNKIYEISDSNNKYEQFR